MTWRTEAQPVTSTGNWRDEAEILDDEEQVPPHLERSRRAQAASHAQDEADDLTRDSTVGEDATALLSGAADYASGGALPALVAAVQGTRDIRPNWLRNLVEPLGGNFNTGDERPFAERKTEAEVTRDDINTRAPRAFVSGQAVGAIAPGGLVGRAAGSGAAARHATPGSLIRRAAGGAVEGAKAGAPLGAIAGAGQTDTGELGDVLSNAAAGGVGGAIVGGGVGASGATAIAKTRLGKGGLRELAKNMGIDVADIARVGNAVAEVPYLGVPAKAARAIGKAIGVGGPAPKPRTKVKGADVSGYEAVPEEVSPFGSVEWTPPTSSSSASAPAVNVSRPSPSSVKFAAPVDDVAANAPKDIRAAAIERMTADDVGSAVAKGEAPTIVAGQRVDASKYKPQDANEFLAQEEARIAREAETAWRSLPPVPPAPRATKPVTDEMLTAAVNQAVKDGISLPMLAKQLSKQLGVRVNQSEIAAKFKNAQRALPLGKDGFQVR